MSQRLLWVCGWVAILATNLSIAGSSDSPTVDQMRSAIHRAIPLLEAGSIGSANERQCFTCHSQALPVFALLEAKRKGFRIDESNLRRQLQHTHDHLERGSKDYLQAKGQGGDVLTAGYGLWTLQAADWPASSTTDAVCHYLLTHQNDLPHWRHRSARPPTAGSDFTATYAALRGVITYLNAEQREPFAVKSEAIHAWIREQTAKDTEDRVYKLATLDLLGVDDIEISNAVGAILDEQKDDGGWAQRKGMTSDAYATATSLMALLKHGDIKVDHGSIQRGLQYLVDQQQPDGSWHVTTRAIPVQKYFESGFPHGKDQFISISATAWAVVALALAVPEKPAFDLVITGGQIIDGTGAPWYLADLGIRDGKIAEIGSFEKSTGRVHIDASGLTVAPGFIDMMGQSANPFIDDPKNAMNLLTQGITTINAGEGASAAPLDSKEGLKQGWTTMAEYFAWLDMQGLPVNVTQTIGHTQVRRMILGDVDRRASPAELAQMENLVREAMQAGSIGVSTALIYPPAVYAPTQEITALARIAGSYGGGYFTHMRNEGDQLLEAIDEAIEIGTKSESAVHIFHLKAAGGANWDKMPLAIERIQKARREGLPITADVYPYINNGLGISAFIHPRHFKEGDEAFRKRLESAEYRQEIRTEMETTSGWENWFRHVGFDWDKVVIGQTNAAKYKTHKGLTVAALAREVGEEPWDTFFELVAAGAFALPQSMREENLTLAMQQPFVSFCTDVGPSAGNDYASHPRAYGAFARILSRYVREQETLTLERAIAQATSVAANSLFIHDRGRIAPGLFADLIVFDPKKIEDRANFANPHATSIGIQRVIVNGQVVLAEGGFTGKRPGKVLRGPGYQRELAPAAIATGLDTLRRPSFDHHMQRLMEEHGIVGAAIAVTDQGKLIHSRGYGYADLATHEAVRPESLFRIASISKPITAVAILQLVEQGKLRLEDKIFDKLDYEEEIAKAGEGFDVRQRDITIDQLLAHRGGWDRDKSFDAMFQSVRFAAERSVPAPAGPSDIIACMLRKPLDFAPGERYAYSNYGYCLLGRLIEKVTEEPYEAYVKARVLAPAGIQNMRLGKTQLSERSPNEVRYYHPAHGRSVFEANLGERVPSPYGGWYLEAMDAHGGWIASAEDLVRFAAAFDDPDHSPLLSRASIERMYARPEGAKGDVYYSLGWNNRVLSENRINHWHTGSLPGTATILIRRHDGKNFAAVVNSRESPKQVALGSLLDKMLHQAADE